MLFLLQTFHDETAADILLHLQEIQRQMDLVRQCGRRHQRRRMRARLGSNVMHQHYRRQVSSSSFNSTMSASYIDELHTPETLTSVELSSCNFTVSFTEQQHVTHATCEISSHNYSRSFGVHHSKKEHGKSTFRRRKIEPVNEISDIQHNSRTNLHYQASTSQIAEGPLNSSIFYPNNSTPRKGTTLKPARSDLSECVKELVFDSDNSGGSPTQITSSGSTGSTGSDSSTYFGQESSTTSPCSYTATLTTFTTASANTTFTVTENSKTHNTSNPPSSLLSCTIDSDATAFLERPLNPCPVTYNVKSGKCSKSNKYHKMTRQLRGIRRQIQKGSRNLNLKTLAVI